VIKSFADKGTRKVWNRSSSKVVPPDLRRKALQKLVQIDYAGELGDLRIPPGNRLEKLSGDRGEQYSIRINTQYRVCFVWKDGDAYDVEIVDYH
jgi:proteic killer suppression protein